MRQTLAQTRRPTVAKRSMATEARQLADLLAGLRESHDGILRERSGPKLTGAEIGLLDERRNNLRLTIAALEDRLSAMQGLIDLDRSRVIPVH